MTAPKGRFFFEFPEQAAANIPQPLQNQPTALPPSDLPPSVNGYRIDCGQWMIFIRI
jgi:hypothetical protein